METKARFRDAHSVIYAVLGIVFLYVIIKSVPDFGGPYGLGIKEIIAGIIIFLIWLAFNGRGAAPFSLKGLKEAFRFMRAYYIFLVVLCAISVTASVATGITDSFFNDIIDAVLVCSAVGVVEEFTCRGMLFDGLRRRLGDSPRAVFIAAVISGTAFGFIHVFEPVVLGGVSGLLGWCQVLSKTLSAGAIGVVYCYIWLATGNIWSIVILHGVNDLLEFWTVAGMSTEMGVYVAQDEETAYSALAAGFICFLIYLPYLIRCVRNYRKRYAESNAPAEGDNTDPNPAEDPAQA